MMTVEVEARRLALPCHVADA
ncbi:WhiB family transcriptional regulator, partial [Mycobacteroides abscessus subsp. massiliense]|nr:WhiB family transcriptional regulator [Mycobacteroides abscessus subsp. massiliense]